MPKHAHYMCSYDEEVVELVSKPPLSEDIETIWVLGGVECYKVSGVHKGEL